MKNSTEQKGLDSAVPSAELPVIERSEAKEKGLNHYFTGRPCCNGHKSIRYVKNGICLECKRISEIERRSKNPEKYREAVNKYYKTDKGKEASRRSAERYRNNPKNKESIARGKYASKEKNRCLYNAISKTYAKRVRSRIPVWQSTKCIKDYYVKATELGMEVDHIVPITSDLVCGLHCIDNFQMLTREENASKGNRYWPDMP